MTIKKVGTTGNDEMTGVAGDVTIMVGGLGNDTYTLTTQADTAIELVGQGIDTIRSGFDYKLSANVENLAMTGAAIRGEGNELNNLIIGTVANNLLIGGAGADILDGGAGNDTLDGGAGADRMIGGTGNDTYMVDSLSDIVEDSLGVDTVITQLSELRMGVNIENLTLTGTARVGLGNELDNVLTGNAAANVLIGNGGNDTILSGLGDDVLDGGAGNDKLFGGDGADTLYGDAAYIGAGNDVLDGGAGNDVMAGGAGNDIYYVDSALDQIAEVGDVSGGVDSVVSSVSFALKTGVENLTLTGNAMEGVGNDQANVITGNAGANNLVGAAGNDVLNAGAGDDRLDGGVGDDRLDGGAGFDVLTGGLGNDVMNGGVGSDVMAGGAGNDVYYVDNQADQFIEVGDVSGGVDSVISSVSYSLKASGVENLTLTTEARDGIGNEMANVITGNASANSLFGEAGNDVLNGGAGNDILDGGDGNDLLNGGDGNDMLAGGAGVDRLTAGAGDDMLYGGDGNDILDGGLGVDRMTGGNGNDTYFIDSGNDSTDELVDGGVDTVVSTIDTRLWANIENLVLTGNAIEGVGNDLSNVITGSAARNYLGGGLGNDVLSGGGGDDRLDGGAGNDRLDGGAGVDLLIGGAGADIFFGNLNGDTVLDFVRGVDKVSFAGVDANTGTTAIDAFSFISGGGFTAVGQVRAQQDGANTVIYANTGGDLSADVAITLVGVSGFNASDFAGGMMTF